MKRIMVGSRGVVWKVRTDTGAVHPVGYEWGREARIAREMLDVIVAGGGPAGLGAAILARQRGLAVRVVEPRSGAIDKACGEGLMPAAVRALASMGVDIPVSHPFEGVRYVADGWSAEGRFSTGPGLGVRRTVLHAALGARADALGVERHLGRVKDIEQGADHVVVDGVEARWLIAADGLHSGVRKQLGLGLPARRPRRLGIRQHFATRPWSGFVEVHWSEHAEAYVTPVSDDTVGVALLYYPDVVGPAGGEPPFERLLRHFPDLAARLGDPASQVRGAGPFEQRVKRRRVGRVLLVGDAAGYLDPLTGEGVRLGLATADAAVRAIVSGRPEGYERAWRRATRRYFVMTEGLLQLARWRWTRRRLVPALRTLPWLMSASIDALGGH
jgi:flavin-dependent dehydrogenase